ncbi:MAG: sugar transferase [Mucilaginibacter sp.]
MTIRYSKFLPGFTFLSDLLLLNLALYNSHFIKFNTFVPEKSSADFIVIVNVAWVIVSVLSKNFVVKRPLILRDNINRFLLTLIYHLLLVFGIIYFLKIYNIPRSHVMISYSLFFVFILIQRSLLFLFLDHIRMKGYNHRRIILIGDGAIASRLVNSFSQHPEYGYDMIDYISDTQINNLSETSFFDKLFNKQPHEIFICYRQMNREMLTSLLQFGDEHAISVKVVSDLVLNSNHAELISYHNVPVLHISSHPEISLKIRVLKRGFDILFSTFTMVLGAPVFLTILVITKATSKGPAFFRQERIGRNGKPFYIYKFRSMYVDAEKNGPQLSSADDARITRWGRVIRKTRLDELPQFWNVMKGEMSVVGPRPERQHYIEKILSRTPNYKKLMHLKPGITSMGQVHYGYAENVDQMCSRMRYDLIYLQNVNLNADLSIILKTVKVMMQRKGK